MNISFATPGAVGVPSEAVVRFLNRLESSGIPMHSVLLLRENKLFLQAYYAPYKAGQLHRMFSISKSLTALAIGLLVEDEIIHSLDDPVCNYFPEYVNEQTHPWILAMTIREMLTMRTCHASTTYKIDEQANWVESFFRVPPTHPSGKLFHYDTSAPHTLAALAEKLTGKCMLDYLREKCLDAIGFSSEAYMIKDPFGVSMGGSGLVATSMDLVRLGLLLLHEGADGDRQLLPKEFLQEALSLQSETLVTAPCCSEACGYGYQFWRNEMEGWVCYGMGGQLIIGDAQSSFLCVTTADTQGIVGGNQMIYDALYQEIYPYLSKDQSVPLEGKLSSKEVLLEQSVPSECKLSSVGVLEEYVQHLCITSIPQRGEAPADFVNGASYQFYANGAGFQKMSLFLDSDGSEGTLNYRLKGQDYVLPFGIGKQLNSTFPGYGFQGCCSGAWLADGTFYLRFHLLDEVVGSVHFQLSFGTEDVTVFLRKQEESYFPEYDKVHLYGKMARNH